MNETGEKILRLTCNSGRIWVEFRSSASYKEGCVAVEIASQCHAYVRTGPGDNEFELRERYNLLVSELSFTVYDLVGLQAFLKDAWNNVKADLQYSIASLDRATLWFHLKDRDGTSMGPLKNTLQIALTSSRINFDWVLNVEQTVLQLAIDDLAAWIARRSKASA
ncbi:MAG TPA: hypothetical protein P5081_17890 [Phycisphaerae bacterium]|nr:hypothetical protein [Phycisphaerae bacterium]